mgnify:FL=1
MCHNKDESKKTMKGIQLTQNVRFLSMEDDDGKMGLVLFHDESGNLINCYEIHSRDELKTLIADAI